MIDCIIFSKDRACQLHLLLDSLAANADGFFDDICVIYRATRGESLKAYDLLQAEGHSVQWLNEDEQAGFNTCFGNDTRFNFKNLTEQLIESSEAEYLSFLVDDNIIYRPIPEHPKYIEYVMENLELFCFSFRLGMNTTHEGIQTTEPANGPEDLHMVDKNSICWDAAKIRGHTCFGYPFAVDGHVMRKKDILDIITYYYDNPNGLEGKYRGEPDIQKMGAFVDSVLVNTPLNLVGSSQNWTGYRYSMSLQKLNEKYLAGERIDLKKMDFSAIIGCHQELELKFG